MIHVEDPEEVSSMLAIKDEYLEEAIKMNDSSSEMRRWMLSKFLMVPPPYTRKT